MTLRVHRSERGDVLVAELAHLLAQRAPQADPFAADLLAVPTRGTERWIRQRLAHHLGAVSGDGVCARLEMPSPVELVARCLAVAGPVPQEDPWSQDRLPWGMLSVLQQGPEPGEDASWETVRHYLAAPGRLWTAAGRMAELFNAYAAGRGAMVRDWLSGGYADLPEDLRWQAELYRRLQDQVGVDSPALRVPRACARLQDQPDAVDLPDRVGVFGPTRVPADQLDLLQALATHREVDLWLVTPTPQQPQAQANRLLASWGRDARQLQQQLHGIQTTHHLLDLPQDTVLHRLQTEIAKDLPASRADLPGDDSIQVHACHGPARQVEVLREVVLHLLEADPTLELRDMIVMCPDVERFAPLLTAAFGHADVLDQATSQPGAPGLHPGHRISLRIADRALHQANPLLGLLVHLTQLPNTRLTAGDLLDLLAMPVVRQRFRFTDDELERVAEWASQAGVRWGLDADHRHQFRVALPHNTWRLGLDRILLGVAMAEENGILGAGLPLDVVESADIDLAGRLAAVLEVLTGFFAALRTPLSINGFTDLSRETIATLAAPPTDDTWMADHLERTLQRLTERAGDQPLAQADLHQVLLRALAARPSRAGFRTGDLTVCTLAPMRAVPHRAILLLGMDDDAFPRRPEHQGEDVLLRDPRPGERDRNSEDRQLLLDAVMAATDHLVVLYSGMDEITGRTRPPAVPIAELLDAVPQRVDVRRHPLQPFDIRNLNVDEPFSHDPVSLAVAEASQRTTPPGAPSPGSVGRVPELPPWQPEPGPLELETLIGFLLNPARSLRRHRFGLIDRRPQDQPDQEIPLQVNALEEWGVVNRILQAVRRGVPLSAAADGERRRGTLPPGSLGGQALGRATALVGNLMAAAAPVLATPARSLVVREPLSGTITGVHGDVLLILNAGRVKAEHLLRGWVTLLALAGEHHPTQDWTVAIIGRDRGERVATTTLRAPDQVTAQQLLGDLVALFLQGMAQPLPMLPATGHGYAEALLQGRTEQVALGHCLRPWQRDRDDASFTACFGDLDVEGLAALNPGTQFTFQVLAQRIWEPLLAHEVTR